jgi:sterol desaturase/sphingolipid hydroxylase (fatty acid hydroxylase superfamily)
MAGEPLLAELEAPRALRRFGSGWYAGLFAFLSAVAGLGLVLALRFPNLLSTPELAPIYRSDLLRPAIHGIIMASWALAVVSLLLGRYRALGITALGLALAASLIGTGAPMAGAPAQRGIFFGLDFFILNMALSGLIFAPLERLWPHLRAQRLFRPEWQVDLVYFLLSSMLVQAVAFVTFGPSRLLLAHGAGLEGVRAAIAGLPLLVQVPLIMLATDLIQYWLHRAFHRVPFLWRFHAVHHSARAMDWLAGSRLHFLEIAVVRGLTTVPMFTLGFAAEAVQAYVAIVYLHSALIHANIGGERDWWGHWIATPRYHHWHHARDAEAVDRNFAIHFPLLDKLFGTFHLPPGRWPTGYGVADPVPAGWWPQFVYPWRASGRR